LEERGDVFSKRREEKFLGCVCVGAVPEKVVVRECGGKGDRDSNGASEGGGEGLEEVDLGVDSGLLFEKGTAEAGGISGGVGAIFGGSKKDHLDKGRVY